MSNTTKRRNVHTYTDSPASTLHYPLGHDSRELDRLAAQGSYFGELTSQLLQAAGLRPGMRVLDVGCGAGDVSMLAALMVGPNGSVLGVDKSVDAVRAATQRIATTGFTNIRFAAADLANAHFAEEFDAVIGRLVLMYVDDPAATLRRLTGFVKVGGIVAFHEFDIDGALAEPSCPLFETTIDRLRKTFVRAGIDMRLGLRLPHIFRDAGLPAPQMILGARIEHGPDAHVYEQLAGVTRTMLPLMESQGVATGQSIGIDTLAQRLREEAVALDATLVAPSLIGAWARRQP